MQNGEKVLLRSCIKIHWRWNRNLPFLLRKICKFLILFPGGMNFSKFHNHYWTSDGVIKSFHLDIPNSIAEIQLSVHKREMGKALSNSSNDKELLPCNVRLT